MQATQTAISVLFLIFSALFMLLGLTKAMDDALKTTVNAAIGVILALLAYLVWTPAF